MNQRYIRGWEPLQIHGNPKISMAIATYEQTDELACLLYTFRAQTYPNWEAVVVHDGPGSIARNIASRIQDPRIRVVETPERLGNFGHPWRELGIQKCTGDYIGLTNGDNYYVPVFFEWVLHALTTHSAELVYCDLVHSHAQWSNVRCGPAKGMIDLGCYVASANLMRTTPWTDFGFFGDGVFFESLRDKARGVLHIPKPLFVHN